MNYLFDNESDDEFKFSQIFTSQSFSHPENTTKQEEVHRASDTKLPQVIFKIPESIYTNRHKEVWWMTREIKYVFSPRTRK